IAFASQMNTALYGFEEIWVMDSSGEQPRKVMAGKEGQVVVPLGWSPNSNRIAYLAVRRPTSDSDVAAVETFDFKSGKATRLLSDPQLNGSFSWLADGHILYSRQEPPPNSEDSNLWELRVNSYTGEPEGKPKKIGHWSGTALTRVSASAD